MGIPYVSRVAAGIAIIPLSFAVVAPQGASAATDTHPPTAPHLYRIAGLGGCELDMRIALSADESDAPATVRYQVLSNGAVIQTVHASTTGSAPGFGNLDVFANPSAGAQSFTVVGIDTDGNQSQPSNAVARVLSSPC